MGDTHDQAVAAALRFVERRGSHLQKLRAQILKGEGGGETLIDALRTDPCEGGDGRTALLRLLVLAEHELLRSPWAGELIHSLETLQQEDGSWLPRESARPEEILFHTGDVAGLLVRSPSAHSAPLARAGAFLAERWSPDLVEGSRFEAILAYSPFFSLWPHELSDPILQWCGRELERGVLTGVIDALSVARLLGRCEARALPGARVSAAEVVARLLANQDPDSGALAGPDTRSRVESTLDFVHAVRRLAG